MVYKIVVFDFDETIGNFIQLKVFWESIKNKLNYTDNDTDKLNNILNIFPEYFRPKIMNILKYLLKIKKEGLCKYIMVYTNNPNKIWIQQICNYINGKLEQKVFNKIICAFKSQGVIIEPLRKSNNKNKEELLECLNLPLNTQICFIDDQYYELMDTDNVYYINIKPYLYSLKNTELIDKYYKYYGKSIKIPEKIFKVELSNLMNTYNYTFKPKDIIEHKVDIAVSKKLLEHIKQYFNKIKKNKTRKKIKQEKK